MAKNRDRLRIRLIRKLCQNYKGGGSSSTSAYSKSQAVNISLLDSHINAHIKIPSTFCFRRYTIVTERDNSNARQRGDSITYLPQIEVTG